MTTSLKRPSLSKPTKGETIPLYALSYSRARNKNKAHSMILEAFSKSGMTKSQLAKMLNKRPEQITRLLAGPGNMTLETVSDMLFALQGCLFAIETKDELSKPKSNMKHPEWFYVDLQSDTFCTAVKSEGSASFINKTVMPDRVYSEFNYEV